MAWEDGYSTQSCNIDISFDSTAFNYDNAVDMVNDAYKDCEGDSKTFRKLLA